MSTVYCVMLKYKRGPGQGRIGYHSVWADKAAAEHQCKIRNEYHKSDCEYFVEEKTPARESHSYSKQRCIFFEDSAGGLLVDARTLDQVLNPNRWWG